MNISCAFQAFGEWIDGCLPSLRKELDRLKWPIFAFCYLSHPTPEFWEDFRHLFVDSYGDAVYELLSSPPPTVVRTDIHLSALAQRLLFAKLEKETLSIDGKTYVSKAPKEQRRERNKENDQSDEHKTKNAKGWSDILLAVNSCFRFHISAAPNFPKSTSPSHPLSILSKRVQVGCVPSLKIFNKGREVLSPSDVRLQVPDMHAALYAERYYDYTHAHTNEAAPSIAMYTFFRLSWARQPFAIQLERINGVRLALQLVLDVVGYSFAWIDR